MVGFVGIVEASVLGWTNTITQITTEVRNLGLVLFGLGIILIGIRVTFRRHMEDIGESLAAVGVGGALIGTGLTVPAILLGFAAGQALVPDVTLVGLGQWVESAVGFWLYLGWWLSSGMLLWRTMRHGS